MTTRPARDKAGESLNRLSKPGGAPNLRPRIWDLHLLNASQRIIVSWFWVALVVSVVFLLAIPVQWYLPDFMPGVLSTMQLTRENNLGAWWSGALLFMLALHAYDAYVSLRERAPKVARAWAILAAILAFLSADEIGSMHERLGIVSNHLGLSDWALVLPLGAVIGVALLYALQTMWQGGEDSRSYVVPLFVGFAVAGSVAFQEFIEHAVDWDTGAIRWIRAAIEEGSELLGMILLLHVILRPTLEIVGRPAPSDRRLFTLLPDQGRNVFFASAVLIPPFTILAILFTDGRGRLADWLAVAAFLTAGLVAVSQVMSGENAKRGWLICIAGLSVLASMTSMLIDPTKTIMIGGVESGERVLALALISLLIGGLWLAATETLSRKLILFVAVIGVFLLLAVLGSGRTYSFLMTQILAVLVLAVTYLARKAPERPIPEIP